MLERHALRLLSQLDKNPLSPYYGCFHRDFWHYRMVSDFPSAVYQMGVLPLSLFVSRNMSPRYYQDKELSKYILAAIRFWGSLQNRDGSYNEWYPNEHSHVATAFTTWGISESLLILDPSIRDQAVSSLGDTFKRVALFLDKNIDTLALNHTAGAIAALYNLYLLTGQEHYLEVLAENKQAFLSHQDAEGWYSEYGDFDAGYQTLSIFFLAQYWAKSHDEAILDSLRKAVGFLKHFVHADGTFGGGYLSRDTRYFFRYGFHLLGSVIQDAAEVLAGVNPETNVNLDCVDDRYFIFFFLPDFLLSYRTNPVRTTNTDIPANRHLLYPNCGIFVKSTDTYQLIVNLKKGCSLELFHRPERRLLLCSLGYMYRPQEGLVASTAGFGGSRYEVREEQGVTIIRHNASFLEYETANPLRHLFLFFRLFNYLLGRYSPVGRWLGRFLKSRVKTARKTKGSVNRTLVLTDTRVEIEDDLKDFDPRTVELHEVSGLSFRFVPSAKFSSLQEDALSRPVASPQDSKALNKRTYAF